MQNFPKNQLEFILVKSSDDEDHLAQLHRLQNVCLPSSDWSRESINKLLENDCTSCFIIKIGNEFAGFSLFNIAAQEGEIISFGVAPEHRGNGYGKTIMEETIGFMKKSGVTDIHLEVSVENDHAIKVYSSLGFQKIGVRKKYYQIGDKRVDAIQMSLRI